MTSISAFVFGIPIFILTLVIIIMTFKQFIKSFKYDFSKEKTIIYNIGFIFGSVSISILGPVAGLFLSMEGGTHLVYDDLYYTPINHNHLLTITVLYAVAAISYWVSRQKGNELSPIIHGLIMLGMTQGFILCIFLAIQLGGFMVYGFIPVLLTFPTLCPVLFSLLLFIEMRRQFHTQKQEIMMEDDGLLDNEIIGIAKGIIKHRYLENPLFFFLVIPFIALQQIILILFGQQPDSTIRAFMDTCSYTFSQFPIPPQIDGHYLCTMASRGNPALVKPLRKGFRGGKVIDVNRQLMIANAFEEWLENHSPRFHYYLRAFYNKVGKPLNDLVQSRFISNIMYIIMKPLEWFFLTWLYLFDHQPENRIQRQYLFKKI